MRIAHRRGGFTLIEILIVISIIAVLASMILGGVTLARKKAFQALATTDISNLASQVKRYYQDTGKYPGAEYKDHENAFPALFEALFGLKPPQGKGGPSAPYMEFKEINVLVRDDEAAEDSEGYRQATKDELYDPRVEKYLADPWGMPYVYHEIKSRARKDWHHGRDFDIYSTGPNKSDQTTEGADGAEDDIGSW